MKKIKPTRGGTLRRYGRVRAYLGADEEKDEVAGEGAEGQGEQELLELAPEVVGGDAAAHTRHAPSLNRAIQHLRLAPI